ERRLLAELGWYRPADAPRLRHLTVRQATTDDAAALAELAAATFPLACPPELPGEAVAAFVAEHLSPAAMAGYLADDTRLLLLAEPATAVPGCSPPVGYTMLVGLGQPEVMLDKCYVAAGYLGSGLADSLLRASLESLAGYGARRMVLGTNRAN